jgi:hypothetical protein
MARDLVGLVRAHLVHMGSVCTRVQWLPCQYTPSQYPKYSSRVMNIDEFPVWCALRLEEPCGPANCKTAEAELKPSKGAVSHGLEFKRIQNPRTPTGPAP